jgi:hypothetical protein
LIFTVDWTK